MERLIWSSQMENFRGKRDFLKGRPKFPIAISERKFMFHFVKPHLWYQFQTLSAMGRICANGKHQSRKEYHNTEFAYQLPKPWTKRFSHVNGKQPKSFESREKAGHSELPFPFKICTKYALKRDLSNVCTINIARDMFLLYLYLEVPNSTACEGKSTCRNTGLKALNFSSRKWWAE